VAGVGTFGDGDGIRAIWAGVGAGAVLDQLRRRCETAIRRAGLSPDTRAWKPHVTLAYLRGADPIQVAAWCQRHNLLRAAPFRVERFGLYSSWPSRDGSDYRLERSYPLRP
jgi:2'-5' RNA ligase